MKAKPAIKIILDLTMTVLFLVLTFGFGTSGLFHETAGIGIFLLYLLHLYLNAGWLKKICGAPSRGKKLCARDKMLLSLDLLLGFAMLIILITGVFIARILFALNIIADTEPYYQVHKIASYVGLAAITAHLAAHAGYIAASVRGIRKNIGDPGIKKAFAGTAAAFTVISLLYYQLYIVSNEKYALELYAADEPTYIPSETDLITSDGSTAGNDTASGSTVNGSTTSGSTADDEDKKSTAADTTSKTSPAVTLAQFLSGLNCNGCHKRCSLLSPRCSVGEKQADAAETRYEAAYGDSGDK